MNIKDVKSIPLDEFLKRLGFVPDKERSGQLWFRSPFRDENTASFKLSTDRLAWYDHGDGFGGNIIDLVFKMTKGFDVSEALKFIENTIGSSYVVPSPQQKRPIIHIEPLYTPSAVTEFQIYKGRSLSPAASYLTNRGIDPKLLQPYLRDVTFFHQDYPKQTRQGFGIQNNNGGFELRMQVQGTWLKTCVGYKGITHFPANRPEAPWFSFEGIPDFGTFLSLDRPALGAYHYLILNGASMTNQAIEYLKQQPQGTLIQCPQKGRVGEESKEKFFNFVNENHWIGGDIKYRYEGFSDYNEWHMNKLNL